LLLFLLCLVYFQDFIFAKPLVFNEKYRFQITGLSETSSGSSYICRPTLSIRPLFTFPEDVLIVATVWSFREGKWVQESLPQQFSWANDIQMSIQRITLPNFNQLASLDTGQVFIEFYNLNTGLTQSISFYVSNKGGKKQAAEQIEKKEQRHAKLQNRFGDSVFMSHSSMLEEEETLEQFLEKGSLVDTILTPSKEEGEDESLETSVKENSRKRKRVQEFEEDLLVVPEDFDQIHDLPPNLEFELPPLGLPDPGYLLFLGAAGVAPTFLAWCYLGLNMFFAKKKQKSEVKKILDKKIQPDEILWLQNIVDQQA